jgi:streptogramin lyase
VLFRSYACTNNSFYTPYGLTIDGSGNLWVADAGNGRVLRFNNASSLTNGANADGVLGQTNFTTGAMASTPTQSQFALASSLCFTGTTLWVCDHWFNRVLRFDNAVTKPNGANADGVLGQVNFTSSTTGTTMSTFNQPFGVCADGKGNLYMTDQLNSRTLIFLNAATKSNGALADHVLQEEAYNAMNLAVDNPNGKLFVADRTDCRVVEFAASGALTDVEQNETKATSGMPKQFQVSNYPNPFNPSTSISIFIPYKSLVDVEVCDMLGRTITTLMHKDMSPGSYNIPFDGTSLSSGVYFCRLKAGSVVQTQKLVLSK